MLCMHFSYGQGKTISGNVTDQDGLPLPGVSIVVVGTNNGTQTDFDGNYSISAATGQVLRYSYIGQTTVDRTVGASSTINVTMEEDAQALEEVVVTALGIERSARSLGYGVTTVKADDLNEIRETNVLNALQGKTTGVVIQNQSGNVGGSQRILIRGVASLQGDQQPLFVIDGVPISNANTATGSRITGGFDFGNRAQDINPDDVESISILKGASAAALYGSRAANGVVLISTKKGKEGRKASFQFNSSVRFDNALVLPDFQNEFAFGTQDADGNPVTDGTIGINQGNPGLAGWGERISDLNAAGRTFIDYDGEVRPFRAFENNIDDFYETGSVNVTSFSVSGADENSDYRASLSYTDQQGIIPNQSLNRTNLGVNSGFKLNDKLKSRLNFNYVRTNTQGTVAAGANDPNIVTNIVNGLPRVANIDIFRDFLDDEGNQINTTGLQGNNPFFVTNQNAPTIVVQRFFGSAQIEYQPIDKLNLLGRAGYDTFTDTRLLVNRIGTLGNATGGFTDDLINNRELTLDFIASYTINVSDDFTISPRVGTQWNERVFERTGNIAQQLTVPNLFAPGNAANNAPFKDFALRRIAGVFGEVTFDYKGWAFLNLTGRNDWASSLPLGNRSFFYPSVSASVVLTDALDIKSDFLNYLKVRGNWANVGVDTGSFLTAFNFNPDNGFFGQFGTGGTFPFGGNVTFNSDGVLPDLDLVSENQTNFEIGLEFGLFNNRIRFDGTYYENTTEDQIISLPTPQVSGFGAFLTNLGEISNKGLEIQLGVTPFRSENFSWDIDANFTTNEFTVEDLGGLDNFNLATGFSSIGVRAVEGETLQLFGTGFNRALDANGDEIDDQILVNADGIRTAGQERNLGQILPEYTLGLSSAIRYKGFALATTFDIREGGVIFSNTVGALRRAGLAIETAANGRADIVDTEAFMIDGAGNVVPNTIATSPQSFYAGFSNASIPEGNVFDASFISWRELSLTYSFPSKILDQTFIDGLRVGVQARNLAIFNTEVPHVNPEAGLGGAASNLQGIERGGVPITRSIGMNLNINF